MKIATVEQLARACFARLCPWIAKEYPEWPVEKSTTMRAYIEGYEAAQLSFGIRAYSYKHTARQSFYLTINGTQVGNVMFSRHEAELKIESVKRGEPI